MHVLTGIAGWIAGAAFLISLAYLAGWLLRGGNGDHGRKW